MRAMIIGRVLPFKVAGSQLIYATFVSLWIPLVSPLYTHTHFHSILKF